MRWRLQIPASWRTEIIGDLLTLKRFTLRYGPVLLALVSAGVIGWTFASSVSNYTHGGWEIHIEQRFDSQVLINLHFHHWYYGIPLFIIALLLIRYNSLLSTFVLGLGVSLSAHSFINEHGIPSIIEGGPTLPVPPEVYFPVVTGLSMLYAFFLIRREEWLARERERERIAVSYIGKDDQVATVFARVDGWAEHYFQRKKVRQDADTKIWYAEWRGLDKENNGEWQLHYTVTPFEPGVVLWVFSIEHIPLKGSVGLIDEWIHELDDVVRPELKPILLEQLIPAEPAARSARETG